jgi:tripartite-type tricarboxylate transporter receptor subunit TctC
MNPLRTPSRRNFLITAGALGAASFPFAASAQSNAYKLNISWPPGGLTDAVARLLADRMSVSMKKTIIVQNKPGAGGQVGTSQFKALPPDGETVLLASLNEAMLSAVTHSKLPYDVEKDLVPVSMVADFPFVLATPANGPATLQEFMAWARRNPKDVSIGCAGAGTPSYYHGLMLGAKGGFDANMIPFLGGAPLMTALAGGQVAAGMNAFGPDMIGMHRAGRTRIIGMTGDQRSVHPEFTSVPTFAEAGLPTIPSGWFGMFLPVGSKPATILAWNQALADALAMEDVRAKLLDMGLAPRASTPQALGDTVRKELVLWNQFFKSNGFEKIA